MGAAYDKTSYGVPNSGDTKLERLLPALKRMKVVEGNLTRYLCLLSKSGIFFQHLNLKYRGPRIVRILCSQGIILSGD